MKVFNNLNAEMARKKVSIKALAEATGINYESLKNKMSGTTEFKRSEMIQIKKELEYHADGQPCRYYSAADMQAIITTAMWHVSYHTTYCNALNMWVAGAENADDLQQIFYGADVPEQYQSEVLKAYLLQIAAMAGDDADA